MLFFRIFQHLLPTGEAWRTTVEKTLRRFFLGLGDAVAPARQYVDLVWYDAFPDTTRELATWENQFGLLEYGNEAARRLALAGEWAATGGQSPAYLRSVLDAAGFSSVSVHEWWASVDPWVARDPRSYTNVPRVGTVQCTGYTSGPPYSTIDAIDDQPQCSPYGVDEFGQSFQQPQCNRFLANDPRYLVNKTLTDVAPPPIPEDPATWRYFIYFGDAVFGNDATLPASERDRFERLILKLCPTQQWLVTMITYTGLEVFDDTFDDTFE